jgi:hypothetical protein
MVAADANLIPVLLSAKEFPLDKFSSVYHLISKKLKFYTPKDVEALAKTCKLILLIVPCIRPYDRDPSTGSR